MPDPPPSSSPQVSSAPSTPKASKNVYTLKSFKFLLLLTITSLPPASAQNKRQTPKSSGLNGFLSSKEAADEGLEVEVAVVAVAVVVSTGGCEDEDGENTAAVIVVECDFSLTGFKLSLVNQNKELIENWVCCLGYKPQLQSMLLGYKPELQNMLLGMSLSCKGCTFAERTL
ncbi:hypothetical protein L218DRAFT_944310 [Marasmius fiardii PR-910]|nr:hypothetical protein L218DRAFT_944310 [Marasmius fiardii PR-910]